VQQDAETNIFETSTAAPVYLQLHQRLPLSITSNATTITSFASFNDYARIPLATAYGLFFLLPTSVSLRDTPPGSSDAVLRWHPTPTPLCRPRLTTLMLFDANNSKSSEADTVDCSVFSLAQCHATAKVLNDEAEIDVKMAEIRSGEEYDAGRHCRSSNLKKKTA